jgi:multidrug efflux pump subunit AcrB
VLEDYLPSKYEPVLRFVLRWRYPAVAATILYCAAVLGLVQGGIIPFVFIQEEDAETIVATLEMAAGTSEERTLEVVEVIENAALACPAPMNAYAVIGAVFDNRGQMNAIDPATLGQVTLELLTADEREQQRDMRSCKEVMAELRGKTADIPGVNKLTFVAQSGGPVGPELEVRVAGEDFEVLRAAVNYVRDQVQQFEGVFQVEDDMSIGKLEVQLQLRETARALGLTTRDLALLVRSALYGFEAQELQDERGEIKVRVVLPEASRVSLADLERLRVPTPTDGRVPLTEVASLTIGRGFGTLARVDGRRAVTVKADVDEDTANSNDITNRLQLQLQDIQDKFPGVAISFVGQRQERDESFASLSVGFPTALLDIYAIIAVLFRSYTQPLIVMAAIPYSLIGAILGHLITGYPFTLLSMIGGVALAGIVVNDSLILVDFVNRERAKEVPLQDAVIHGGKARLRAILLTSLTTISGLAPIMLERSFQTQFLIPMAVSIVFGLAFATGLTLLLIPVLYLVLEDIKTITLGIWSAPSIRRERPENAEVY